MLIAILIVSILIFLSITVGFRATNERINDLEATLDEIKKKTDKLGTHNY